MHFTEVNLFGVYVAPIAVMLVVAWLMLLPVRRFGDRFGAVRYVAHPALFWAAIYLILLAALVLFVGR
jgi:protein AaeX